MGEITKILTIYLDSRGEDIDIEIDCEYEVDNDGIGEYEFWGQQCVDKGTDYAVITGTEWDKTGFTAAEIDLIEKAIDKEKKVWEGEIDLTEDDDL